MKQKNKDYIIPLKLIKDFNLNFPNCFNKVEEMRKLRGTILPNWNTICYIPINATLAIAELYSNCNISNFPATLAALSSWRTYKEIYSFNKDFTDLLFEQADDIVIPIEVLFNLPYPCVYIQLNDNKEYAGYFVHFDYDTNDNSLELRFVMITTEHNILPYTLHLKEGFTLKDSINDVINTMLENCKDDVVREQMKKYGIDADKGREGILNYSNVYFSDMYQVLSKIIQPVLYLCAENADIKENQNKKQTTKRETKLDNKDKPINSPKDAFREIRQWDTGYRISYAMRKSSENKSVTQSQSSNDNNQKKGTPKRPHSRRGHWHHYWCGSQTDRKLILK